MNHHKNLAFDGENVAVFLAHSFQILTLLDMLKYLANFFFAVTSELDSEMCKISMAIKARSPDSPLSEKEYRSLKRMLQFLDKQAIDLGLQLVDKRIEELEFSLLESSDFQPLSIVLHDLKSLQLAITRDLSARTFIFLPPDDLKYYNQKQYFGPEVFRNFPSTQLDVAEAANCYALERYTACVFHCMRVLEKGLRALVNQLNSKHNAQIVFKPTIEYQNWQGIITAIRNALKSDRNPSLDPQSIKQERGFYSKAAREFQFFKDAWRNEVAHGNEKFEYDAPEASRVMEHVKTFMNQLAKYGLTE